MTGDGMARAVADRETVMLGPNRVAFLLGGADTAGAFSLTEFVMAPPPAPGPPLHVHTVEEETIYLLDRRLSVTLRERITELSDGAVAHIPKGVPHTLANLGPGSARLLIVQSPPGAERYWAESRRADRDLNGNPTRTACNSSRGTTTSTSNNRAGSPRHSPPGRRRESHLPPPTDPYVTGLPLHGS
jgi:quercetin dioxygenase-like cupin family protein